ncbi:TPA: hypothetical protein ACIJWY_002823 [Klebsiella oxytoca]|uniref:hypothetical protein n=1 Tax=Klebsiella oxytoca TaxID=571 RepID=UPI00339BA6CF
MKKMMILCAVISLPAFSAETMPFSDAEVLAYLKPSSEDVFSNAVTVMVKNDAEASLQKNITKHGTFAYTIKVNEKEIAESCSKPDDNCFKKIMNVMDETKKPDSRFVSWMSKLPE